MKSEFKALDRGHRLARRNAGAAEIAARRLVVAPVITGRIGDDPINIACSRLSLTQLREGVINPRITPASVAWMPDASSANQMPPPIAK